MNTFLHCFADELVKLGAGAPLGGFSSQIGVQRMESPAATPKQSRYRPSAGYSPDKSSDPVPVKKNTGGGGGRPRKQKERVYLPFEGTSSMKKRVAGEAAYNKAFDAKKSPSPAPAPSKAFKPQAATGNISAPKPASVPSVSAATNRIDSQKLKI